MKEVEIYTDGACSGNPGPGGWGAVLRYGEHEAQLSGYEKATTNQRMELTAAVKALRQLKEPCRVRLFTDSAYLANAFKQRWLDSWQRRGWLNSKGEPVSNRDLWEQLLDLAHYHDVQWIKVKGHSDNELNNQCDALARRAIKERGE